MKIVALEKFNESLVVEALKLLDKEALASKLAKTLERGFEQTFQTMVEEETFDFQYYLNDRLSDPKTPEGKAFEKAMGSVVTRMVKAISPQ